MGHITKPNTFTSQTKILSAQVNDNFDTLYTQVNAHDDTLTTHDNEIGILSSSDVSLKSYVVADGVTDDTANLQTAIKYCFDNGKNLIGFPGTCKINSTVYLPSNPTAGIQINLDFKGLTFQVTSGVTLFESGIYSSGAWSSTFAEANDTHMSFGVTLKGFRIIGGAKGVRIANWHQGCSVTQITAIDCTTAVEAKNCYYSRIDNVYSSVSAVPPYTRTAFVFSGDCNLMRFSRLVAANSNIGYQFTGPLTACQLTNLSFEGMAIGVQFDSEVYDCVIENSYMENVSDTVIKCGSYVDNLTIRNNYANFIGQANMYFIDYVPLPLNNIIIEQDNQYINMTDDSKIFKTKDNTAGYNNVTFKRPPKYSSTPSDLLIDNTKFSDQMKIEQELNLARAKGKVVNSYAPGIYSGRYSGGFTGGVAGTTWVNNSNAICTIDTKIVFSDTQRIYVNLKIAANVFNYIKGEFIGTEFWEWTASGSYVKTTALSISTVGGYQRIVSGTLGGTITGVDGEIRLI